MTNVNQFNVLSERLREEVNKYKPKKGQIVYFASLRPNARGTTVMSKDQIYDPWAENETGENGRYIDIAYVVGRRPSFDAKGQPQDPNDYGRIQFRKQSDGGQIPIRGGNKRDELLFDYLFLTNQSKTNVGKEWFIPNEQRGPSFQMVQKSLDAVAELDKDRLYRAAGDLIDRMPDAKLREYAIGLELKGINKHSTSDEIRALLIRLAKKEGGAGMILKLDKDINFNVKVKIKEAEKYGIVARDPSLNTLNWAETGEKICTIPDNKNFYQSLTSYFVGKGQAVYKIIERQVEEKKESEMAAEIEQTKKKPKKEKAEA